MELFIIGGYGIAYDTETGGVPSHADFVILRQPANSIIFSGFTVWDGTNGGLSVFPDNSPINACCYCCCCRWEGCLFPVLR